MNVLEFLAQDLRHTCTLQSVQYYAMALTSYFCIRINCYYAICLFALIYLLLHINTEHISILVFTCFNLFQSNAFFHSLSERWLLSLQQLGVRTLCTPDISLSIDMIFITLYYEANIHGFEWSARH